MQNNMNLNEILLYFLKRVNVTFTNGDKFTGTLQNVDSASNEILIDNVQHPLNDVVDIEMIGKVDYHAYAKNSAENCEIDGIFFGIEDFVQNTNLELISYDEFNCIARCHLTLQDGKISANDVNVISFEHKVFMPALENHNYLYLLNNGESVQGMLKIDEENHFAIKTSDDSLLSIEMTNVKDIIRLPRTNEYVYITKTDGTTISGTVSAANETMIVLIGESAQIVQTSDIVSIRYKGTIQIGTATVSKGKVKQIKVSLGDSEETFLCKRPYFATAEDAEAATSGATALFTPGVTDRGLIAKDITIDNKISGPEETRTGIIIVAPTRLKPIGYIGDEFVAKPYSIQTHTPMPFGSATFTAEQIPFPMDPHVVYIVRYSYNPCAGMQKARNIELVDTLAKREYARIWFDENDQIHTLHLSAIYMENFIGKKLEISLVDGNKISGTLLKVEDTDIIFSSNGETLTIDKQEINQTIFTGTVTTYQNNGIGFIDGQFWFHVNDFKDVNQIFQLNTGVTVKFTLESRPKGNGVAATDLELISDKKGYLVKYISGRGYALLPEELEAHLKSTDKRKTICSLTFNGSDFVNAEEYTIDTMRKYYLISYRERRNKSIFDVKILQEFSYQTTTVPQPKAPVIPPPVHTETLLFSDLENQDSALIGQNYSYGLINFYTTHKGSINTQYFNKNYVGEMPYSTENFIEFDSQLANIAHDSKLKTQKFSYLVRFVKKEIEADTSEESPVQTVDYNFPIEVVREFTKKQYTSIAVEDDQITLQVVDTVASPESNNASEMLAGESICVKYKDGSIAYNLFATENENAIVLSDGESIDKADIAAIHRFGVITSINITEGYGTINDAVDFSLSIADAKMLNILKNQKSLVRLHIMYTCVKDHIVNVCRISDECLHCIPWIEGVVTQHKEQEHSIEIDSDTTHYLSVMSEGVNTYVNDGIIVDRPVFVKRVFHPYTTGSDSAKIELVAMALDVRCQEENLTISYDAGRDVFFGYRNPTRFFPILTSGDLLQDKIGESIPVRFRPSSNQATLEAYLDGLPTLLPETEDDSGEEPSAEKESLVGIQNESLSMLLIEKEEIEQMLAGGKILLDSSGIPVDCEQAQHAADFLVSQNKRLAAVKVTLAYPECKLQSSKENLIRAELTSKCRTAILDTNSCYGESAYYLTTLLSYASAAKRSKFNNKKSSFDYLYQLLLQDFETRETVVKNIQIGSSVTKKHIGILLNKKCLHIKEFVSHIVTLNNFNFDIVSQLIQTIPQLSIDLVAYAKEVDDTISSDEVIYVLRELKERYTRDKGRFTSQIIDLVATKTVSQKVKAIIGHMQSRFLRLISQDDCQRFERLFNICSDIGTYINKTGFALQESILLNAYRELCALEDEIKLHPCRESVEMLLTNGQVDFNENIFVTLKSEVEFLLNQLYQTASVPKIICEVNENNIEEGVNSLWLLIQNGEKHNNLQSAENLSLQLESFTEGVSVESSIRLPENKLSCGEQTALEVKFDVSKKITDIIELGWTAQFEYTSSFHDGTTNRSTMQQESVQALQFQITTLSTYNKDYTASNPYAEPASGQPLITKDMFFGREYESKRIRESIIHSSEDSETFIPGSAVIIHGQKKSGKTSLVNQIKNYIKESPTLADKAIMLNFSNILDETGGVELLSNFKRTFYTAIMSRFEDEICDNHPDVVELLEENKLEIPDLFSANSQDIWPVMFDKFFRDFAKVDKGQHNIILFMDEFTILCTTILSQIEKEPTLTSIPNFIKTFSQYGFIQIIIGHEAMMRALDTLGVLNHTAEFAETIEIAALNKDASYKLVVEPMSKAFGYNTYETELGKQAVEYILDLSGRNPAYLMRLCNRVFQYYTNEKKCSHTQLVLRDVINVIQEYIDDLLLSDFDILMLEDGDETIEAEERKTYHYLKTVALLSVASYDKRTADSSEITRELIQNYNYSTEEVEKTRNILEARRVISITNGGRVKINTGLFAEYIIQKNGMC